MPNVSRYPTDQAIIEGVGRLGSISAYAKEVGIKRRSLSDHIHADPELKQRVEEAKLNREVAGQAQAAAEAEGEPSQEDKLRQERDEYRKQAKRLRREATMEERIFDRLRDYIPQATTRYEIPQVSGKTEFDEHEFVLLFSDTHAAEVVDLESTLGMNEYDWDTMLLRMQKMQKSVLSYQRNRPYPIRKLWVMFLGDMLSGDIHEELRVTNDRTVEEAVVDMAHDCAEWLLGFAEHFEEIVVVGVPGNHPRRTQKPEMKLKQNNADWLTYKFMSALLRDHPQFTFDFPKSGYADAYICDRHHMLLMHGDGIRTTMPGVPWGGVMRRVTTLMAQFSKAQKPIQYVALGHFHTTNAVEGVGSKVFMNGSVKGVDEYSMERFGHGQDPAQLLLTFHPDHGVTDVSYIDLMERE